MSAFFELFINPRFWGALAFLTLPLLFGLLSGAYMIAKETIEAWTKKEKNI